MSSGCGEGKLKGRRMWLVTGEYMNTREGHIFIYGSSLKTAIDLKHFKVNSHSSHSSVGVCVSFQTGPTSAKRPCNSELWDESRFQRGHKHHYRLPHLIWRVGCHHSQCKQNLPAADRKVTYKRLLLPNKSFVLWLVATDMIVKGKELCLFSMEYNMLEWAQEKQHTQRHWCMIGYSCVRNKFEQPLFIF